MQQPIQLPLYSMNKYIHIRGLYTFIYAERKKNFSFSGERHNFWELVYADSGEILVSADGVPCTLRQGEMIFHMPMEFHTIAGDGKHPHSVLVITFESDSPAMRFFEHGRFVLDHAQREILNQLFKEAEKFSLGGYILPEKLAHTEGIQAYQTAVNHLECLLIDLIRKNDPQAPDKKAEKAKAPGADLLVRAVNAYLESHVCSQLQLQDICGNFNMSRSQLCEIYRNTTGTGIIDHFINLKIRVAKYLIREEELNYTQISERLGFSSLHHFTRTFRQRTQMTPSAYKRSIQSEEWTIRNSEITPPEP